MKFALMFLVLFGLVGTTFSAPLLFKGTKEIATDGAVELTSFDASKYRQLRVVVKITRLDKGNCAAILDKGTAKLNLDSAQRDFDRYKQLADSGVVSKSQLEAAEERLTSAKAQISSARDYPCPYVLLSGGEADDVEYITDFGKKSPFTGIIDSPPTKLVFTGFGQGKYTILIYGQ